MNEFDVAQKVLQVIGSKFVQWILHFTHLCGHICCHFHLLPQITLNWITGPATNSSRQDHPQKRIVSNWKMIGPKVNYYTIWWAYWRPSSIMKFPNGCELYTWLFCILEYIDSSKRPKDACQLTILWFVKNKKIACANRLRINTLYITSNPEPKQQNMKRF